MSGRARAADAVLALVATIVVVEAAIRNVFPASGAVTVTVTPFGEFRAAAGPLLTQAHLSATPSWLLLGVALTAAPLAFRRMYPTTTFCVILAAVIATSHYATLFTFAMVIFAAYCAVIYSRYRGVALLTVVAGAILITAAYPNTVRGLSERYTPLLVLIPTVALGSMMRVWRLRAGDSAERLRRAEAEHEAETRRAIELERARIASELHDVVTHNVSVMVIQAGAARQVLDSSPGDAREALLAVEASGRTAMTELRHLLGLLAPTRGPEGIRRAGRGGVDTGGVDAGGVDTGGVDSGGDAALSPQPGVAQIPALLARVSATGLPVELSIEAPAGARRALPPGIDLAVYRVVQEGLTNVMKHAGQARTVVHIEYRPRELAVTVSDDGRPPDALAADPARDQLAGPGGRGLIGLRERIAIYGGELDAGPCPGGGWRVSARIPLDPATGEGLGGADEDMLIRADFQATPT